MKNSRLVCILSMEISEEPGEFVAHCPELQLTDHGATQELAESRLRKAVSGFVRICAERGTLLKVLEERGVLEMEDHPARTIEVPIPVLALTKERTAVR